MDDLNKELVRYIENNVLPNYEKNDKGHQIEHIQCVIERSFELSKDLNVDKNIIYTVASYHDYGCYIDRANHEKISARIMFEDVNLQKFFSTEERIIIKEAIEDHRASLVNEPRSVYGKIVSSADRNTEVNVFLQRIYGHALRHFPDYTEDHLIEWAYNHTKKKFGPNGYAKMYFKDEAYENYLKEIANLINNKESFVAKFKEINNI